MARAARSSKVTCEDEAITGVSSLAGGSEGCEDAAGSTVALGRGELEREQRWLVLV